MKVRLLKIRLLTTAATVSFTVFASAFANGQPTPPRTDISNGANLIVVHGIPGRDVGAPQNEKLPVDVLVNGELCLLKGLTFGSIAGPIKVPAGTYRIAVSLADRSAPCSHPPIIRAVATLREGIFSSFVAALSPQDKPAAELFPIESFPIQSGTVSFLNANASDGPVTLTLSDGADNGYKLTVGPGQYDDTKEFGPSAGYSVTLSAPGSPTFGPFGFRLDDQGEALLYTVGSAKSRTLTLLTKVLVFK